MASGRSQPPAKTPLGAQAMEAAAKVSESMAQTLADADNQGSGGQKKSGLESFGGGGNVKGAGSSQGHPSDPSKVSGDRVSPFPVGGTTGAFDHQALARDDAQHREWSSDSDYEYEMSPSVTPSLAKGTNWPGAFLNSERASLEDFDRASRVLDETLDKSELQRVREGKQRLEEMKQSIDVQKAKLHDRMADIQNEMLELQKKKKELQKDEHKLQDTERRSRTGSQMAGKGGVFGEILKMASATNVQDPENNPRVHVRISFGQPQQSSQKQELEKPATQRNGQIAQKPNEQTRFSIRYGETTQPQDEQTQHTQQYEQIPQNLNLQTPTQPYQQTPTQPHQQIPTQPYQQIPTQPYQQVPTQPYQQIPNQPYQQTPTQQPGHQEQYGQITQLYKQESQQYGHIPLQEYERKAEFESVPISRLDEHREEGLSQLLPNLPVEPGKGGAGQPHCCGDMQPHTVLAQTETGQLLKLEIYDCISPCPYPCNIKRSTAQRIPAQETGDEKGYWPPLTQQASRPSLKEVELFPGDKKISWSGGQQTEECPVTALQIALKDDSEKLDSLDKPGWRDPSIVDNPVATQVTDKCEWFTSPCGWVDVDDEEYWKVRGGKESDKSREKESQTANRDKSQNRLGSRDRRGEDGNARQRPGSKGSGGRVPVVDKEYCTHYGRPMESGSSMGGMGGGMGAMGNVTCSIRGRRGLCDGGLRNSFHPVHACKDRNGSQMNQFRGHRRMSSEWSARSQTDAAPQGVDQNQEGDVMSDPNDPGAPEMRQSISRRSCRSDRSTSMKMTSSMLSQCRRRNSCSRNNPTSPSPDAFPPD